MDPCKVTSGCISVSSLQWKFVCTHQRMNPCKFLLCGTAGTYTDRSICELWASMLDIKKCCVHIVFRPLYQLLRPDICSNHTTPHVMYLLANKLAGWSLRMVYQKKIYCVGWQQSASLRNQILHGPRIRMISWSQPFSTSHMVSYTGRHTRCGWNSKVGRCRVLLQKVWVRQVRKVVICSRKMVSSVSTVNKAWKVWQVFYRCGCPTWCRKTGVVGVLQVILMCQGVVNV